MSLTEFDVYRLDGRTLGKYGESRLSELLSERGWKVYEPAFSLDSYMDLVVMKKNCLSCNTKNAWEQTECNKCKKQDLERIYRTIQVKTSLIEKGGTGKSFAFDFEPKDLLPNPLHFLIGMVYDVKGKEFSVCCTPPEFVKFADGGTHTITHTWKVDRGRFHPHVDCLKTPQTNESIPKKIINNLEHLDSDAIIDVDEIIDKHEMITWGNEKYNYYGFWSKKSGKITEQNKKFHENKKFLKRTLIGDLNNIVNSKTYVFQIIKGEKLSKPVNENLETKGQKHSDDRIKNLAFFRLQENHMVFKAIKKNEYLAMKVVCEKCEKLWDREAKECYRCKIWQPPLRKCHICKGIVANDRESKCPSCYANGTTVKLRNICIKCECEYFDGSTDARNNMNRTYFTPITFCQNCGNRSIKFEFEELK